MIKESFAYSVTFNTLLKSTQQSKNILIDLSSDFEWVFATWASVIDLGAALSLTDILMGTQFPAISVTINDNSKNVFLADKILPINNMFGRGQYPAILPEPLLFVGGSNLTVTVINNYTNFDLGYLQLTLFGRKVSA